MASRSTPRAYTNAIVAVGSSSRAVVRFTCVDCSHELEIANNDPRKHGSFFAQQARKRGWDTDGEHANRVWCPDCRKTPVGRTRRQVELDSVVLPALGEPPVIEGKAEYIPEAHDMPRELTQAQRMQIRRVLDQYFDDKEGCYLPGLDGVTLSDQAIGQEVGVPWAEVTRIREAAYGKILVDPALAALRNEMSTLAAHIANGRRDIELRLAEIDKHMADMHEALEAHAHKRGAA